MKLTFLGTGTSMGVPVAGGFGSDMMDGDPRNERYRCSAWVEHKGLSILIDASPEFRLQTLRAGIRKIDLVLITHEHMDHISGLDDLRSFNYAQKSPIPLYTSRRTARAIKRRFDYMFGEKKYPGSTSLDIQVTSDPFEFKGVTIQPLEINHGNIDILGFKIGELAYMTDTKKVPEKTKEQIRGCKVMVLSGLRWAPEHPTHLTIPEAVELADELQIEQTYLIHMNVYVNHRESNDKLPDHVQLAFDQLSIEI